jgi:transcriptional regulator with XRE-family HTH domain
VTEDGLNLVSSRRERIRRLAKALGRRGFRHGYMSRQLKAFLAQQIRELRGDERQEDFGKRIGKPQSVISRLEKQLDRNISIQTLIDIAEKLDIAVIIRFVDFPAFLKYTENYTDIALAPPGYDQSAIDVLAREEERRAHDDALRAIFSPAPDQNTGSSAAQGGAEKAALPQATGGPFSAIPPPANDSGVLAASQPSRQGAAA